MGRRKGSGIPETDEAHQEAMALRHYLGRYYQASEQQKHLERRLRRVCLEMSSPNNGTGYRPVKISGGNLGQGSATLAIRKTEIEDRIEEQRKQIAAYLLDVMNVLDYLELGSDERNVLELYYIDRLPWRTVAERVHLSRSVCFEKRDAGIRKLLTFSGVRVILDEYIRKRGS